MIVRDRGSGLRSVGVDWPQDPSSTQLLHHRLADSIEEFCPPNRSDVLCLLFCINHSSMADSFSPAKIFFLTVFQGLKNQNNSILNKL